MTMTKNEYFDTLRKRWRHGTLQNAALMTYVAEARDDRDAEAQLRDSGQSSVALMEQHGVLRPDMTVVEIGCGAGRVSTALSEYLTEGKYYGVDLSPQYVAICERRVGTANNTRFEVTDGCSFPFPDSTADLVIEFSIFCHMPYPMIWKWLCETSRILKPSGRTYLQFQNFSSNKSWAEFTRTADTWYFLDLGHPRGISFDIVTDMFWRAGFFIEKVHELDVVNGVPDSWIVVAEKR